MLYTDFVMTTNILICPVCKLEFICLDKELRISSINAKYSRQNDVS